MIILGSASDKDVALKSIKILEKLQIPYSLKVASAHRTHDKVKKLVMDATNEGVEVFIGIAGLAAHLPGAIAAYTHRPVIGVPVEGAVGGLDALYACVQMPFPTAVTTVAAAIFIRTLKKKLFKGNSIVRENTLPITDETTHLNLFKGMCVNADVARIRKKFT